MSVRKSKANQHSFKVLCQFQLRYHLKCLVVSCLYIFMLKKRGKLDLSALKCVFVGYSTTKRGYKCYHQITRKPFLSMDVTFVTLSEFESLLNFKKRLFREDKDFFIDFGDFGISYNSKYFLSISNKPSSPWINKIEPRIKK